jgi:CHAT domain-containing protein
MSEGVTEHLASRSAQSWKAAARVMAHTPSQPPLDLGTNEAHSVKEAFPEAEILNNPKKSEVLALLSGGVSIVHFTCHSEIDYSELSKSMLLLDDWETDPFTVGDIRNLNIKEAQLAILSACFTANAGDENLQDEISHMVSSFQIAGFCSLIGSYWYLGEHDALEVTKGYYGLLAADKSEFSPKKVVRALHFAVLRFRESTKSVRKQRQG